MYYIDSTEFFESSIGPQSDNTVRARLNCLKDFLKRAAIFPFALFGKAWKTSFRILAFFFSSLLVLITLGGSGNARELFMDRIAILAQDLADWILLPMAVVLSF